MKSAFEKVFFYVNEFLFMNFDFKIWCKNKLKYNNKISCS